jgi:VWFA-related protein
VKKPIILIFIVFFLLFCFLSGFEKQQKSSGQLRHEVTVELVVVEVFATDKEGKFVSTLTKDDFEIYEDGKRVDIQYFQVVTPEMEFLPEEVSEETRKIRPDIPPQKMKLVILFDNLNTNRFFLVSQWPQIVEMLKSLSSKVEAIMVMELSRESGAQIILPFTSDQDLFSGVISKFKSDLSKNIEEEFKKREIEDLEEEARKAIADRFISNPYYIMDCLKQEESFIREHRLGDSLGAFLAAINYIRNFDGIKAVLIVSDGLYLERISEKGIIFRAGHYLYIFPGLVRLFDPFKLFGEKKFLNHKEAFEKFVQIINEERIIFYAFSPKGIKADFSTTALPVVMAKVFEDEMKQWAKEKYSLEELADETGGMYLKGAKKYEDFINELGRDLTHFYDISYTPPQNREPGYHKIEVRVKKPGLRVRYKQGYSDFTPEEIEKRKLASIFLSPSLFREIDFSCKTDFIALRGGYLQFWIRLKIPVNQLRSSEDSKLPKEIALLFGINQWAEDRVHTGGRMIEIREEADKGIDTLYRAFITSLVNLKPGEYETRLVLKETGDRMGGWEGQIKIPELGRQRPFIILNAICGFLTDGEEELRIPFSVSIQDGSLLLSKHRFYPLVENILKKGKQLALFVQTYIPNSSQGAVPQFLLHGTENTTMSLGFEKVESDYDEKLNILSEVYLVDTQNVLPGDYRLIVKSSDSQDEKSVEIKVIF